MLTTMNRKSHGEHSQSLGRPPRTASNGKSAGIAHEQRPPLLLRDTVKRGRPRQLNLRVPSHIDQAKLPSDVYFDHRWTGGTWYIRIRDGEKRRRKNIANSKVNRPGFCRHSAAALCVSLFELYRGEAAA